MGVSQNVTNVGAVLCVGCEEAEREETEWRGAYADLAVGDSVSRILWAR